MAHVDPSLRDLLDAARAEAATLREELRRTIGALRDVERVALAAREVARRAEAVLYGEDDAAPTSPSAPIEPSTLDLEASLTPSERRTVAELQAIDDTMQPVLAALLAPTETGTGPTLPPRGVVRETGPTLPPTAQAGRDGRCSCGYTAVPPLTRMDTVDDEWRTVWHTKGRCWSDVEGASGGRP